MRDLGKTAIIGKGAFQAGRIANQPDFSKIDIKTDIEQPKMRTLSKTLKEVKGVYP